MTNPFHPYPEPKLTIELVPTGQWEDNLRSHLTPAKWNMLRSSCYVRAQHKCEICGGVGNKHPVECHEIWDYNDETQVQKLLGLIALCPPCHQVKHIGLAAVRGFLPNACRHLGKVNQWPMELVEQYVGRQFQIHQIRSAFSWMIDLSWLHESEQYIAETESIARQRRSDAHSDVLAAMTRKR